MSNTWAALQHAKKVVSDSLGLVDFAVGIVNSVLNLPNGQVVFWGKFKLQKNCNQSCSSNFFGLVEMTFGLVHASYSFPEWLEERCVTILKTAARETTEWQAVKLTFFAPCILQLAKSKLAAATIVSYGKSWTAISPFLPNNKLFIDTDSERALVVAFNLS